MRNPIPLKRCSRFLFVLLGTVAIAGAFPPDWQTQWRLARGDATSVQRNEAGELLVDVTPKKYITFFGGEEMSDFAVTARVKFLQADDKYSGFSIYLRSSGNVWARHSGFWVYLRPKYRGLYMQKMVDGRLDKEFPENIQATRPAATPIGQWLLLRCEVRGRDITVFLNGKKMLSAREEGRFPILRGRMAFGLGDCRALVAELTQENLAKSRKLPVGSYRYLAPPTAGTPAELSSPTGA